MCSEFIYPIASCSDSTCWSWGVMSLSHAHSRGHERGKRSVRQNPLRMESGMMGRSIVVVASVLAAWSQALAPAVAGELKPDEAKKFIAGKYFSYACFEGTAGAGRINADGSVVGTIQIRGAAPAR